MWYYLQPFILWIKLRPTSKMRQYLGRYLRWCAVIISSCMLITNAQSDDTDTNLLCGKDSIQMELSERYISEQKIEVTDPRQLHFNGFPECHAEFEQSGFSITLYPPYKNCGTKVQPGTDHYSYYNEIVYETEDTKILIYKIRCLYDKKYVVSSDLALTPVIRTLNFRTERGEFSVGMGLYQRRDFNPKSMFGLRPTVLVGRPVYVSVDMIDTFGKKEMVTSIETCYATDDKNHAIQNLYHSLIVNKCSSPDDDTVEIISNGEALSARFRFQMFQWRSSVEYFYLHCEVKVCNTSAEECSGIGPVCAGVAENDENSRRKRDIVESNPAGRQTGNAVEGDKGIVTYGPIVMKEKGEEEEVGEGSYETVYEELEKDQRFLKIYIYVALAAVIVVAGIIVIIITVVRKTRAGKRNSLNDSISTDSI